METTENLTPKQEAFARHYAAGRNGAAAARAAGYAPEGARQTAHELLQRDDVRTRVVAHAAVHDVILQAEVGILLTRLDGALDAARDAGDHRALAGIVRLQAQLAGLLGPGAAERRVALYDREAVTGPLARARRTGAGEAARDLEAVHARRRAEADAELAEDEAELARLRAACRPGIADALAPDPDISRHPDKIAPRRTKEKPAGGPAAVPGPDISLPMETGMAPEPAKAGGGRPAQPDISRHLAKRRPPATTHRETLMASAAM